jgi:predicted PurR-regulated permease PerM
MPKASDFRGMLERLSPSRRRIALGVLAALVLWFLWTVRAVINPILLGYLLAFVLHPMVQKLEHRGLSRKWAVGVIFSGCAAALTLTVLVLVQQGVSLWRDISRDGGALDQLDRYWSQGYQWVHAHLEALMGQEQGAEGEAAGAETAHLSLKELATQVVGWVGGEQLAGAGQAGLGAAGWVGSLLMRVFGGVLNTLTLLLLLPIYTYYLLFELENIHGFVVRYLPRRDRAQLADIAGQIGQVLASFFRGRLLVCLLKGLFISVGLLLCGVPYALILGLLSGFMALVPFVGAFVGFVLAIGVSLLEMSPLRGLLLCGLVFGLAEIVEGYVLLPKVMGDSLGLHPLVVLAALMIGGAALGMFGLLVALPLAATIIILARELVLPALRAAVDEEH